MVRWPAAPRRVSSYIEPSITAAGSSAAERSQRSDAVHTAGSTSRMCSLPSAFTATSVADKHLTVRRALRPRLHGESVDVVRNLAEIAPSTVSANVASSEDEV